MSIPEGHTTLWWTVVRPPCSIEVHMLAIPSAAATPTATASGRSITKRSPRPSPQPSERESRSAMHLWPMHAKTSSPAWSCCCITCEAPEIRSSAAIVRQGHYGSRECVRAMLQGRGKVGVTRAWAWAAHTCERAAVSHGTCVSSSVRCSGTQTVHADRLRLGQAVAAAIRHHLRPCGQPGLSAGSRPPWGCFVGLIGVDEKSAISNGKVQDN